MRMRSRILAFARLSFDFTVPTGNPVTSAISLCE
jgi:hypothetical protein